MRRDVTAALRLALQGHLSLRKSRLESFCVLVVGVLLSRTVNLSHLACMFPTRAEIASNYRRLQRFFEQVILDGSQLARVIVRIAGVGSGPWLLALDRTCWKFGRYDINVLMLAIIRNGIAIPLMWDVLGRAGTSTTAQRSALLSRFCAVFGETAIAGLIADREFIGRAWMTSLAERDIPFILRIKDTFHVRLADGRQCQVRSLFRKVGVGGRRYIREDCRLGSRDSSLGPPLKLAAMRLVSGDLLVVATNTDPKSALAHYRRRWEIETLFAATKTRGFNFEDTHLIHPDRIGKLLACQGLFQFGEGTWLEVLRRYGPKHGYRAEAKAIHVVRGRPVVASSTERERILRLRRDPYLSALMTGELITTHRQIRAGKVAPDPAFAELYIAYEAGSARRHEPRVSSRAADK